MIRGLAGAAISAGAVLHAGPALAPVVPRIGDGLGVTLRQDGAEGVAITFDDGPHPQGTPAILEILREAGAVATFFLAGHRVELHCYRHRNQLRLTPRDLLDDAERAKAAIEEAGGQEVRDYRPPYGIFSGIGLRAIRQRGWRPVLWSRWGKDWRRKATPSSIAARATAGIGAGDILLLHDADYYSAPGSWIRTAGALPSILATLEERGLRSRLLRR